MKNNKNKNGFTLVELLAVIVILAVLIMFALPNVLRLMETTRINAFKVEAQEILTQAETMYSTMVLENKVKTVNIKENNVTTQYRYACITLNELYQGGYSKKNFNSSNYTGFVEIFIPATGQPTYGINISNGVYSLRNMTTEKIQSLSNEAIGKNTSEPKSCPAGWQNLSVNALLTPSYLPSQYK